MGLLNNKVALVTGGGSGIGAEIAKLYAKEGARVLITDIDTEGGNAVVEAIKQADGKASFFKADVSNPKDSEGSVYKALEEFGALHIACNNAGIGGKAAKIGDLPPKEWDKVIQINLNGVFYGMRYQIPAMKMSGGKGSIVNMASILGQVGFAFSSAYVAAKHGVIGLTKNAAIEYSSQGIRINAVGPGFINTPFLEDKLGQDKVQKLIQQHPIGRLGQPEEVAELVLWLSSEKASFASGGYYPIDGAYLAQ